MDWGLFREWNRKNDLLFLRSRILYPKIFYYIAIIVNFLLRFIWFTSFISLGLDSIVEGEIKMLFFSVAEIIRRIQWCLLRVENENVNNLEKYRSVFDIPMLPDEQDHHENLKRASVNQECSECYNIPNNSTNLILFPMGLKNFNNSCFMNSSLQLLHNCPEFINNLKTFKNYPNIKIAHWFLDRMDSDWKVNRKRFLDKITIVDSSFCTTDPKSLNFPI